MWQPTVISYKQAWILDSDPGSLPFTADRDVDTVLREVQGIRVPLPSRAALTKLMQDRGFSQVGRGLPCSNTALLEVQVAGVFPVLFRMALAK